VQLIQKSPIDLFGASQIFIRAILSNKKASEKGCISVDRKAKLRYEQNLLLFGCQIQRDGSSMGSGYVSKLLFGEKSQYWQ
jgi:hypothetical protein